MMNLNVNEILINYGAWLVGFSGVLLVSLCVMLKSIANKIS